jgi:hypothetical protein
VNKSLQETESGRNQQRKKNTAKRSGYNKDNQNSHRLWREREREREREKTKEENTQFPILAAQQPV